jgi:hypothetical protein
MRVINARLRFRGGTADEWETADPVLADREPGVELPTFRVKVGDGETPWSELPYAAVSAAEIAALEDAIAAEAAERLQQFAATVRVADRPVNLASEVYGADRSGATATDTAMNAAVAAAGGGLLEIPPGIYRRDTPLALPHNVSLLVHPGAIIRAGASMPALVTTPMATLAIDQAITGGGRFDCNNLADDGIALGYFHRYTLDGVSVYGARRYSFKFGDDATPTNSYEAMVSNVKAHGGTRPVLPGSACIFVPVNCTDGKVQNSILMGSETGAITNGGAWDYINVHAWTRALLGWMVTCFDDGGGHTNYVNCYADTPQLYGWRFRQNSRQRIIGGRVFNNPQYGLDNAVIGVRVDNAGPNQSFLGLAFIGADSTHRIHRDFEFIGGAGIGTTILGTQMVNVVNTTRRKTTGGLEVGGDLIAALDASYDLGLPSGSRWRHGRFMGRVFARDGLETKVLSGAGKGNAADGDFALAPDDGTFALVRDATTGAVRLAARVDGQWVAVDLGAGPRVPDFPTNANPGSGYAASAWGAANAARYIRVTRGGTISKVGFHVGTASGNISVAAYRASGTGRAAVPGAQLATSGPVACPAAGYREQSLGGNVTLEAGDYLGLSCDNTTATFLGVSGFDNTDLLLGLALGQASAHPLPASPASLQGTSFRVPILVGVP